MSGNVLYRFILLILAGSFQTAGAVSFADSSIGIFDLDDSLHNRRVNHPGGMYIINGHQAIQLPPVFYYGPEGHLQWYGPNYKQPVPLLSSNRKNHGLILFGSEVGEPFLQQIHQGNTESNKTPFTRLRFGFKTGKNLYHQTYYYQTDHYCWRTLTYRNRLSDTLSSWFGVNVPSISLLGYGISWSPQVFKKTIHIHSHFNAGWRWFFSPQTQLSTPWVGGSGTADIHLGKSWRFRYWHEHWDESAVIYNDGEMRLYKGLLGWHPSRTLPFGKLAFAVETGIHHQSHFTTPRSDPTSAQTPILKHRENLLIPLLLFAKYTHTKPGLLKGYRAAATCSTSNQYLHNSVVQQFNHRLGIGTLHYRLSLYNLTPLLNKPWTEESWFRNGAEHQAVGNLQNTSGIRLDFNHHTVQTPFQSFFSLQGGWETGVPTFEVAEFFNWNGVWFRSGSIQSLPHPIWSIRHSGQFKLKPGPFMEWGASYITRAHFTKNTDTLQWVPAPYVIQFSSAANLPSNLHVKLYCNFVGPKKVRQAAPNTSFRVPPHPEIHCFIRQSFYRSKLKLFVHGSHLFGEDILETPYGNPYRYRLFFGLSWNGQ